MDRFQYSEEEVALTKSLIISLKTYLCAAFTEMIG